VFERFTERARGVVVLAQEEARALKHNYIGTEHILLGLLREQEGLAAGVLASLDITIERVRWAVTRMVGPGEEVTSGQIPFTPRAKKVLELSLREALSLSHNYIGTEHILLGLVRENEGVAARILLEYDADAQRIRSRVLGMLGEPPPESRVVVRAGAHPPSPAFDRSWLDGLAPVLGPLGLDLKRELERDPDTGDLLLALASAPDTRAAAALRALGVDVDALVRAIEDVRGQAEPSAADLGRRLDTARDERMRAVEAQEYEIAAELRDEERELFRALADAALPPEAIEQIRARLGLSVPRERPHED
jgi:ATP-dependent Clp protease ATP-binding subunit ClpA